jgi:hypothetical protein
MTLHSEFDSPVNYTTVFDATQAGYQNWWFPAFGMIFVVGGVLMFRFRHRLSSRTPKFVPYFFLGFAIFWTSVAFMVTVVGHYGLSSALRDGRCSVIEGEVSEFRSTKPGRESFVVGGRRFEYSDYDVTPGFNRSRLRGGPIREGLFIRIHYSHDYIARLEVAQ